MGEILDLRILADELAALQDRNSDGEILDDEEKDRLNALEALEKELGNDLHSYGDNEPTMVPRSEWVDYCKQQADELGYLSRTGKDKNPLHEHINWESWADALEADWSEVTFEDKEYLVRDY